MAHYIQDYLYAEMPEQYVTDIIQWLELEAIYDLPPANKYHYMTIAVVPGEKGQRFFLCEKDDEGYKWVEMHFSMDDYQAIVRELAELQKRLTDLDDKDKGKIKRLQDEIDAIRAQLEEAQKKLVDLPDSEGVYNLVIDSEGKPSYEKAKPMIDIPENYGQYVLVVNSEGAHFDNLIIPGVTPKFTIEVTPDYNIQKMSDVYWYTVLGTAKDFRFTMRVSMKYDPGFSKIVFRIKTMDHNYDIQYEDEHGHIEVGLPVNPEFTPSIIQDPEIAESKAIQAVFDSEHREFQGPQDILTITVPVAVPKERPSDALIFQIIEALDKNGNAIQLPKDLVVTSFVTIMA